MLDIGNIQTPCSYLYKIKNAFSLGNSYAELYFLSILQELKFTIGQNAQFKIVLTAVATRMGLLPQRKRLRASSRSLWVRSP